MGAILGVLGRFLGYLFGASSIKWVLTAFLYYGVVLLVTLCANLLPSWFSSSAITSQFTIFTPGMWYFWNYFQGATGITLILSASVVRFLIRRLPFIG